jgi:phage terminase large subunit-like protein
MGSFNEPMTAVEALAKGGRLRHGGHRVLRWMVGNVTAVRNGLGQVMPSRKKSADKIDGAVALIQGLARAMLRPPSGGSFLSFV